MDSANQIVENDSISVRKTSKNNDQVNLNLPPPVIHSVEVPRTVEEAYRFDIKNGNTLWRDAINKRISKMETLDVFKYEEGVKNTINQKFSNLYYYG